MKYAFQQMQLGAPGFFDLIGTWAVSALGGHPFGDVDPIFTESVAQQISARC